MRHLALKLAILIKETDSASCRFNLRLSVLRPKSTTKLLAEYPAFQTGRRDSWTAWGHRGAQHLVYALPRNMGFPLVYYIGAKTALNVSERYRSDLTQSTCLAGQPRSVREKSPATFVSSRSKQTEITADCPITFIALEWRC